MPPLKPRVFAQIRASDAVAGAAAAPGAGESCCFTVEKATSQIIGIHPASGKERRFTFERCFGGAADEAPEPQSSVGRMSTDARWQADSTIAAAAVETVFGGTDADVLLLGTSGAGKAYSLGWAEAAESASGNKALAPLAAGRGLLPAALGEVFQRIEDSFIEELSFRVEMSLYEVYRESVRDLLDPLDTGCTAGPVPAPVPPPPPGTVEVAGAGLADEPPPDGGGAWAERGHRRVAVHDDGAPAAAL
eukprot:g5827.t1